MEEEMATERRKDVRYRIGEGLYTLHPEHIGSVKDISLGGMLCHCIFASECQKEMTVSLMSNAGLSWLENIPIRIVRASVVKETPASFLFTRKCHIAFDKPAPAQQEILQRFIDKQVEKSRKRELSWPRPQLA